MVNEELQSAIELIRAGDKKAGAEKLKAILKADRNNAQAWTWMYACVETDQDKIYCLEQALAINPNHEPTRKELERLKGKTAASAPYVIEPAAVPASVPAPIPQPAAQQAATKQCPFCGIAIPAEAIVCPYCRKTPSKTAVVGETIQKTGCLLLQIPILLVTLAFAGVTLYCIFSVMFNK